MEDGIRSTCTTRCVEEEAVREARRILQDQPAAFVSYTDRVSGERERLLLLSERTAREVHELDTRLHDPVDALLAFAVATTPLCECDMAVLAGRPEAEVLSRLDRLEESGVIRPISVGGRRYFTLGASALVERARELEEETEGATAAD